VIDFYKNSAIILSIKPMKIKYVKTAIKVGDVVFVNKDKKSLQFNLDSKLSNEDYTNNAGRVYYIVVDDEIVKIGGSQCKGGIKNTFNFYFNGYKGSPSPRTYCCWNYMRKAILDNKKVEVYFTLAPIVSARIPTMIGYEDVQIPVDFHKMEDSAVSEYLRVEKKHPYLNLQESGGKWHATGLFDAGYPLAKRS
jgi:hypothetical protein